MATDFHDDDERLADAKTAFPLTGNAASGLGKVEGRDDSATTEANEKKGTENDDEHSE